MGSMDDSQRLPAYVAWLVSEKISNSQSSRCLATEWVVVFFKTNSIFFGLVSSRAVLTRQ